jgi:hypothetical protein
MRRLGNKPSVIVKVRVPGEWWEALVSISDPKNPPRELIRDALKQFLRKSGKLNG